MSRTPLDQSELDTLEAELRQAMQHREAALQRASEAGKELEETIERARAMLDRLKKAREGAGSERVR